MQTHQFLLPSIQAYLPKARAADRVTTSWKSGPFRRLGTVADGTYLKCSFDLPSLHFTFSLDRSREVTYSSVVVENLQKRRRSAAGRQRTRVARAVRARAADRVPARGRGHTVERVESGGA